MSTINIIHTVFSVTALLAGGFIFFNAKGTRRHVKAGWLYVASMLILLFTSFFIFDLFGGFGVYHALSIVSLVTMGLGIYFPLVARSNAGWLIQHYMWMSYSYVGLVMAGGPHLFALVPDWPSWLRIFLFWGLPYILGSFWIFRNRKRILQEVKERKKLEIVVR